MALSNRQSKTPTEEITPEEVVKKFQGTMMRPVGLALVILGGVLGKLFIFDVLELARNQSPDLTFSSKLTVLIGVVPSVGLLMLLLGPRAVDLLKIDSGKMKLRHYLVIGLLLIPTFGLLYWFRRELVHLGYQFQ